MTHDPLCGCNSPSHVHYEYSPSRLCVYCRCDLIAKVRADERDSAIEQIIEEVVPYGPEFDLARDDRTTAWLIRDEVVNAIRRGPQP